jgi:hypothetical protein
MAKSWIIPTPRNSRLYREVVELEGREYVLHLDWSERDESWYLSIYDQDEVPLALGLRLLVGHPLLKGQTNPKLPPGFMTVVDSTGLDVDPGLTDIGTRAFLVYEDSV